MQSIFSWLSLMLLGPALFITATVFAFFAVFNESTIKGVLDKNNAYEQLVPAVLETAKDNTKTRGKVDIPLNEPWVREVADKSFPAADLQTKTETLLAGTFAWLESETEEPEFTVDFTGNKQALAQGIGEYATKRAAGLPACTRFNLPQSIDALTITCLPPGVSPSQVGQELTNQVNSNQSGILSDPIISGDDLIKSKDGKNPTDNLEGLRDIFALKPLLSWLLPLILALLVAGGLALAPDRRTGIKRTGRILLGSGIGLAVFGLILYLAANYANFGPNAQNDFIVSKVAIPMARSLVSEAALTYGLFALGALAGSAVAFFVIRKLPATEK